MTISSSDFHPSPLTLHPSLVTPHPSLIMESRNSGTAEIRWTVHPIKNNWKVSAGVVAFLVILWVAIYLSFNSLAFLVLSVAILICSLSPFFFPTTYILQDDCIVVKSLLRTYSRRWDSFRSYYPDRKGILLSPFPYPSRLENFRGTYIRLGDNGSKVMDFIKERMGSSLIEPDGDK